MQNSGTAQIALHKTLRRDSRDLRAYVEEATSLPFPLNLIAGYIAGKINFNDGYAYPSIENIMQHTHASRATVSRAIAAMKTSGEWTVVSGRGGPLAKHASARASRYYLSEEMVNGFDAWLENGRRIPDEVVTARDAEDEAVSIDDIPDFVPEDMVAVFEDIEVEAEPEPVAPPRLSPFEYHLRELLPQHWVNFRSASEEERDEVLALARSLADDGVDIYSTLSRAVDRYGKKIDRIIPWLTKVGLAYPVQNSAQASFETAGAFTGMAPAESFQNFLMYGTADVDYGKTGQEF